MTLLIRQFLEVSTRIFLTICQRDAIVLCRLCSTIIRCRIVNRLGERVNHIGLVGFGHYIVVRLTIILILLTLILL